VVSESHQHHRESRIPQEVQTVAEGQDDHDNLDAVSIRRG
jgi:hypothetical protein